MAQLVIAVAGAAIGSLAGPGALLWGMSGAQIGWMAGSVLGAALAPGQRGAGPRLEELRVTGTEYGGGIAWVAGAPRVAGDLIWASDRREIATTEEVGKGGGSEYTTFSYEIDALYLLADQPGAIVTRCWDNGKLIWTNLASADDTSRLASEQAAKWRRITVYNGADAQMPDPTYEAAVTNAPAYTRRLCVFIEGLQLGNSGALPNLTFEVASLGDTNPDFVRRYEVADTGRQFADIYSSSLGRPALLSIAPTVRVATVTDTGTEVYVFNLQGEPDGMSSRTGGEDYPSAAYYPGTYDGSSAPVGIMDGLPVRVANHYYALGGAARHIRAGAKTGAAWDVGILPDLALCLPSGRYLGDTIPCSDGVHLMAFTAPTTAYSGGSVLNRWHIIRRNGLLGELVSEGDIDPPRPWLANGSSGVNHSAAMLEDDLLHVWFAYGAGEGTLTMLKIEPDGVMRVRSEMRSALLSYGFTYPTIWAEGSFCVVVSRQSYQAFRRAGDVIDEVPLQDVVEALCDRATMPAGTYDASGLAAITQPVRALAVTNGSARQALEILQASHGFDAYVTDKLYFVPRGGASVLTIDADDLAAGDGDAQDEPFALTVNADLEMPSRIAVVFKNMDADQVNGTEHSERGPSSQDSIQTVQMAIGMKPGEAKGVADAMVRDAYAARLTSQLSLPMAYTHLTPTDVIQVPGSDGAVYRMRITRRSDSGGIMSLDVVGDDGAVVIEEMATATDYIAQTAVETLALTELALLDIPLLRDADDGPGMYVAARGTTTRWPGAVVQSSTNDVDYSTLLSISDSAVFGNCSTALGDWDGGLVIDERNSVDVVVDHGQLSSTTRDNLLTDVTVNAMLIGSEIIRFVNAQLVDTDPNVYRLTRLIRGCLGTEWAMIGHEVGERAALLRATGLRRIATQVSEIGQTRFVRGITLGATAADALSESFVDQGEAVKPYSPVDIRSSRDGDGAFQIGWVRRTRLTSTIVGQAEMDAPLGETVEAYEVDILDGETVVRTIASSEPRITYGPIQQIEDFDTIPDYVDVSIFQLGAAGRGRPFTGTIQTTYSPTIQTNTITLGGSFTSGVLISIYATGVLVFQYTTQISDGNLTNVAAALAAGLDTLVLYEATSAGQVVTLTGLPGLVYSLQVIVSGQSFMHADPVQAAQLANPGNRSSWTVGLAASDQLRIGAGVTFSILVEDPAGYVTNTISYTTSDLALDTVVGVYRALVAAFSGVFQLRTAGWLASVEYNNGGGAFMSFKGPNGNNLCEVRAVSGIAGFPFAVQKINTAVRGTAVDLPQIIDFSVIGNPQVGEIFRLTFDVLNQSPVVFSYTIDSSPADDPVSVAADLAEIINLSPAPYSAQVVDRGDSTFNTTRVTGAAGVLFWYRIDIVRTITAVVATA